MNSTDEYKVAELKLRCFQSLIGGNDISRIENARKLWAWVSGEAEKDEPKRDEGAA